MSVLSLFLRLPLRVLPSLARSISPANCYVTLLSKLDLPYLISRDFDQGVRKKYKTLLAFFSSRLFILFVGLVLFRSFAGRCALLTLPLSFPLRVFISRTTFCRVFFKPDKIRFACMHYCVEREAACSLKASSNILFFLFFMVYIYVK